MATHSSILSWRIPQIEESSWLQSMGSPSQIRLTRLSTHTQVIYILFFFFGPLDFSWNKRGELQSIINLFLCIFPYPLLYIYIYIYIYYCLGQKVRGVLTNQPSSNTSAVDSGNFQTPLRSQACSATAEAGPTMGTQGRRNTASWDRIPSFELPVLASALPHAGTDLDIPT